MDEARTRLEKAEAELDELEESQVCQYFFLFLFLIFFLFFECESRFVEKKEKTLLWKKKGEFRVRGRRDDADADESRREK